ncbi:MAG: hypothetical protein AABN34_04495 [Acidobacteriota bacterium]
MLGLTVRDAIPQLSVLPLSTSFAPTDALPVASKNTVALLHSAVGGIGSLTVKVVVHVLLLLLASLTVKVIVVGPVPTSDPAAGV